MEVVEVRTTKKMFSKSFGNFWSWMSDYLGPYGIWLLYEVKSSERTMSDIMG